MLIYSIQQRFKIKIHERKDTGLDGNVHILKQSDSWLMDITADDDFQGLCDQKFNINMGPTLIGYRVMGVFCQMRSYKTCNACNTM
jgi:hypothetical protein